MCSKNIPIRRDTKSLVRTRDLSLSPISFFRFIYKQKKERKLRRRRRRRRKAFPSCQPDKVQPTSIAVINSSTENEAWRVLRCPAPSALHPPTEGIAFKSGGEDIIGRALGRCQTPLFLFLKFYFVLQVSKKRAKEKSNRVQVWGDGLVSSRIEVV